MRSAHTTWRGVLVSAWVSRPASCRSPSPSCGRHDWRPRKRLPLQRPQLDDGVRQFVAVDLARWKMLCEHIGAFFDRVDETVCNSTGRDLLDQRADAILPDVG